MLRLKIFIICIIISWLLSNIGLHLFNSEYAINFLWILLSFLSWWILYYGVFKLQIVVQKDEIHQYLVSKKTNGTQTKKKINDTTVSKIITQLYTIMDQEELYKNPLLSRLDLATRLGTNERYLSQIINQELNKNIVQFVNEYRIEAAKNLLHNPIFNKYSVEAIGMEVGFKSKSAFYNTFKTYLGMSPGAFRKLQKTS
ncbi:AraC family transcriptional regulator [Aquimarina sp. MAR_2010_214]|uniref:helix-turn-helix domain-containing protein n=1 Tax=Aquimarina sp. MAR_2010_214 TaxID=1250026 RepID=UPI001177FD0E|nr:helix-turn-helix domain-containing protein [Aquimarina sp. MAR_2010_214]